MIPGNYSATPLVLAVSANEKAGDCRGRPFRVVTHHRVRRTNMVCYTGMLESTHLPERSRTMNTTTDAREALFTGKDDVVRSIYHRLLEVLHTLGPFQEEPKKTSIHLVHRVGFAIEQVSKSRFHNEVKLVSPGDVDG